MAGHGGAPKEVSLFWFRRDLRLDDNTGLRAALESPWPVLPLFIFDTDILDKLDDPADRRVEFIHRAVSALDGVLRDRGSSLFVRRGRPAEIFARLAGDYKIKEVYANHDYEPYALARDAAVERVVRAKGAEFKTFKDQVIFERREVAKDNGEPYTVFTPYSRKWLALYVESGARRAADDFGRFLKFSAPQVPSLKVLGFRETGTEFPRASFDLKLLRRYAEDRDRPALQATSRLGVHLRFGTLSPREVVKVATKTSDTWLKELLWREFFMQILANFPHVANGPFRPEFEGVRWRNKEDEFARWCRGETGFPIVDAGMRELEATGFMHNRVRMIAASFLVKQLLVDWRWGEAFFAKKLLDFELASNNGNWQWVAGSGCDAAPYFRVFNPLLQAKKFDPDGAYTRRWVPELGTDRYPEPMVDLRNARVRTLKAYEPVKAYKSVRQKE